MFDALVVTFTVKDNGIVLIQEGSHLEPILLMWQACLPLTKNSMVIRLFTRDKTLQEQVPEERDYYPHWGPTPWKDIAIMVSDKKTDKRNTTTVLFMGIHVFIWAFFMSLPLFVVMNPVFWFALRLVFTSDGVGVGVVVGVVKALMT